MRVNTTADAAMPIFLTNYETEMHIEKYGWE